MENVAAQLRSLMAEVFNLSEDDITWEASMKTLKNWDSLQHLNLILSVEERFNINISAAEIPQVDNFNRLCSLLEEKLKQLDL